ncbi:MAG: hypothetical protein AAF153_03375 [Pseudomonadota bacterium]
MYHTVLQAMAQKRNINSDGNLSQMPTIGEHDNYYGVADAKPVTTSLRNRRSNKQFGGKGAFL